MTRAQRAARRNHNATAAAAAAAASAGGSQIKQRPHLLGTTTPSSTSKTTKKRKPAKNNSNRPVVNSTRIDDETLFVGLPIHLRIYILNYLGETQDELIILTLVSKQFYNDCKRPGIQWKIIPTIEISPTKGGSIRVLFKQLCSHILDNNNETNNNKFQRYRHMKVNDIHKFDGVIASAELDRIVNNLRRKIDGIVTLDISLPSLSKIHYNSLSYILPDMFPNLCEINISNLGSGGYITLYHFTKNCPRLEKITLNNITFPYLEMNLDGTDMASANNLKEIIMDDSDFGCMYPDQDIMFMSDLEEEELRKMFIFYKCSKVLGRVSIRNAKWATKNNPKVAVPQNALIKFVRNAPSSMRWFRSDLTEDNMVMLRLERPEIELLN